MLRKPGHWVFVHWKRVQAKGTGAGQWFWKRVWRAWKRKPKPAPPPAPTPAPKPPPLPPKPPSLKIEMYDDVNVSLIPLSAEAVAGYVDGKWPTFEELKKKFPHAAHIVSIAVFSSDNAEVLDIEPGDATIAQAASWIKRQHERGEKLPAVYTSVSQAELLVQALDHAGFKFGVDYVLWTAHYTGKPHLCSEKCGFGFTHVAHATQWTDKAHGVSLDESLVSAAFFS